MAKKINNEYVNKQKLLDCLVEYRKAIRVAKKEGDEKPRVPEYIGECILKIAQGLSWSYKFVNYTYRDDMVGDAVENCIQYLDNFNPKKSKNPFGYFTQIIYFAFLRRIQKEQKQSYVKWKMIEQSNLFDELASQAGDDEVQNLQLKYFQKNMNDVISKFEGRKKKVIKSRKKPKASLQEVWV